MINEIKPLISIVTINCNQLEVTCEFLESTKKLVYPNYEIILVDNASDEDPSEVIQKRFPHVKYIRSLTNLGFSGGNNVGIVSASGDFYFIVNNDTEVTPTLLDNLIEPFFSDDSIGIVSPKIRYFSHPNIIQYAGYTEINPFTGRNRPYGFKQEDHGQFDIPGPTSYAHGAAMMVKRKVVNEVGLMPEEFFIYYEELDWSAQVRKAGYTIFYQPTALIFHKESMTMGKESLRKAFYQNRNRILFMRRNSTRFQFFCFAIFVLVGVVPVKTFQYISRRQFKHVAIFFKALAWNFQPKRLWSFDQQKKSINGYNKFFSNWRSWLYRIARSKTLPQAGASRGGAGRP